MVNPKKVDETIDSQLSWIYLDEMNRLLVCLFRNSIFWCDRDSWSKFKSIYVNRKINFLDVDRIMTCNEKTQHFGPNVRGFFYGCTVTKLLNAARDGLLTVNGQCLVLNKSRNETSSVTPWKSYSVHLWYLLLKKPRTSADELWEFFIVIHDTVQVPKT